MDDLPLAPLCRELLERELAGAGIEPTAAARAAAWAELEQLLATHGQHEGLACLPRAALEAALGRALRAARAAPHATASVPAEPASAAAWHHLRTLLASSPPRQENAVGQVLDGKYALEELVAEGGFGRVYRARDLDLDCAVAIKVLKPAASGASELEAFKAEARRLTRLRHPNIVEWKTLNQAADGQLYLVMEFLQGEVLEDVLRREGRLEPRRAARILIGVLEALGHAHHLPDGASLLHLDLKPSNVFLLHDRPGEERIKVLDFGIGRLVGQEPQAHPTEAEGELALGETTRMAAPGRPTEGLACTPNYCPPELARRILGDPGLPPLDGRADLYSLGVMGYRMLTGRLPFEGARGPLELLRRHREQPAPPLGAQGVRAPRRLTRALERCLAKDPAQRFADARDALAEFQRVVQPRPRAASLALLVAVLAVLTALAYARFVRPELLPPLTAVASADGRGLGGTSLFFGPKRRVQAFELLDVPPETSLAGLRLVAEPRAGLAPLAGWELAATGERRFEIQARTAQSGRTRAFLALELAGTTRFSEPFELRYLAPLDTLLVAADVPGRAGRALAPRGQRLEVRIEGEADGLPSEVEVEVAARRYGAARDESRSTAEASLYALELERVEFDPGANAVLVRACDRAGNVHTRRVDLEVAVEPLRIEEASLEGATFAGGRWALLRSEGAHLSVRCNRAARLRWSLENASGVELARGTSDSAQAHLVQLEPDLFGRASFSGALRLGTDEEAHVAHAADSHAGRAETLLALEVREVGAVFDASLSGARERVETGWNEPVRYVAAATPALALLRDHDVPMQVGLRYAREDGPGAGDTSPATFVAPQELRKTLALELPADGRYRLFLEGRRLGPDGEPHARADERRELLLVRDTQPPRVTLDGWREGFVQRTGGAEQGFAIVVEDAAFTPDPPPVNVGWSLVLRSAGEAPRSVTGELTAHAGVAIPFTPPLLGDGEYELELQARDFAGNASAQEPRYRWSVSSSGPRLRVLVPAQGESWARSEQDFTVELRVEDGNGVAAVRCQLVDGQGQLPALTIELAPAPESVAGVGRWEGRFTLDPRWSERAVELRFLGTDTLGTTTLEAQVVNCRVAPMPSLLPAHVQVSFRGHGSAPMRRVPGNGGALYWFGGRGDVLENGAFRAAGLAEFASGPLGSSLRIEIPRGALQDFYLDEHEVSVGQYLEFVRAGTGLDEERRARLERELMAQAPELPVTNISCAEALAYASWSGKELPSYLHWEYAVRGADARPYSFLETAPLTELGQGVNVGTGAPWPVTRGLDRTPDTGILALCSNVAEWTRTPAEGRLSAMGAAELLATTAPAENGRFYAVGGSFARPAFHFAVVTRAREASPSIGFRCLVSAARLEAAFLGDESEYVVVPVSSGGDR